MDSRTTDALDNAAGHKIGAGYTSQLTRRLPIDSRFVSHIEFVNQGTAQQRSQTSSSDHLKGQVADRQCPLTKCWPPPQMNWKPTPPEPNGSELFIVINSNILTFISSTWTMRWWTCPTGSCEGLVTQKNPRTLPKKIQKKRKNPKKSEKYKDFLGDLKSAYLIWDWTTPRIQCLNPFYL